jgi:predicted hotdog family 3-hydroxylacyl-ACP dehydratase
MSILDRAAIAPLIPHAGAMRLLTSVVAFDAAAIRCESDTHADLANPLRARNRLPVSAGIEYAAQAVALHAALQGDSASAGGGSLAVLSDVTWRVDRLDDAPGPLTVCATRLAAAVNGLQYRFEIAAADGRSLIDGVMIVALA